MLDVRSIVVESEGESQDTRSEREDDPRVDQVAMKRVHLRIVGRVVASTAQMTRRNNVGKVDSGPPPDHGHAEIHESVRQISS